MRIVGLLGGMSFEGSAVYYRLINEGARARLGGLHSAELLMHSVDLQSIVQLQQAGRWADAGAILAANARRLEAGGAECVLICANTMHLVADSVREAIAVPFIDIIDETAKRLIEAGCQRPLLLATRYTMEHGFYAERMRRHGLEVMLPDPEGRVATPRSSLMNSAPASFTRNRARCCCR